MDNVKMFAEREGDIHYQRALKVWNEMAEEINRLAVQIEPKQRKAGRAFFRWRFIPSWMRTSGGLLLLASIAIGAAERSNEPVIRSVEYFVAAALGCIVAMQLMRGDDGACEIHEQDLQIFRTYSLEPYLQPVHAARRLHVSYRRKRRPADLPNPLAATEHPSKTCNPKTDRF